MLRCFTSDVYWQLRWVLGGPPNRRWVGERRFTSVERLQNLKGLRSTQIRNKPAHPYLTKRSCESLPSQVRASRHRELPYDSPAGRIRGGRDPRLRRARLVSRFDPPYALYLSHAFEPVTATALRPLVPCRYVLWLIPIRLHTC